MNEVVDIETLIGVRLLCVVEISSEIATVVSSHDPSVTCFALLVVFISISFVDILPLEFLADDSVLLILVEGYRFETDLLIGLEGAVRVVASIFKVEVPTGGNMVEKVSFSIGMVVGRSVEAPEEVVAVEA